jgi:hypothetical protein
VPADGAAARHDIWLLDPAGRVAGTVIVDSHADMRRPCWSPDGRYLAFDASDPPGSRRSIRVAPLAGATVGSALTSGREAAWQGSMPPAPTSPATATPSLAAPSVTAEGTAVTPSPPAVTEFPTAPTLAPFPTPAATGPTWAPPAPTFPPNELGGSAFLPRALRRSSVREAP